MSIIFIDGFEKYGPSDSTVPTTLTVTGTESETVNNLAYHGTTTMAGQGLSSLYALVSGAANGGGIGMMQGRAGGTSRALTFHTFFTSGNGTEVSATRSLGSNPNRIILGFAHQGVIASVAGNYQGIRISDGGTVQCSLWLDPAGKINFGRGDFAANTLFTSTQALASNSWHYIELDVTVHNTTGAYQIWLDGTSITSASSQNTRGGTTNNFANQIAFRIPAPTTSINTAWAAMAIDDVYCFDTGGSVNNAQRGDSTIYTLLPTADSSVQFSPTATAIGYYKQECIDTNAPGANQLVLIPVTPAVNVTVNSIGILPQATNGSVKFKGVIYSDSSGSPGSLLSSGTEVIGSTTNAALTLALVTPQSLTGGTQYWIGYITDTSIVVQQTDNVSNIGQRKSNTYGSGAPSPAGGSFTTAQPLWMMWGNCTGAASNYSQVNSQPGAIVPPSSVNVFGYNASSTIGNEDLFTIGSLPVVPQSIASVVVNVLAQKSDGGARTFTLQCKSSATDSASSSQSPTTTPTWYAANFDTDPNTPAVAWIPSGVNAAKVGYKVAS